ncbi:ATP:cob(I)alamin adenosyltransferase [Candidatus Wolfebacteria bacterium RIFCSPLOWO2_01_FULL_38_11]|uniref:Corrinoid adenosyltransferase n=2 Tax=Candidatus Wolfeibacteriota TaxID=1752735 RepID=A0A0G0GAU8_9BACT|nr:MAG: ATP:cob(I)alamin adenosyltransferase [Candidatus Wolfebacteria bacterium GW2011_GWC1_37_10]OGM91413.1 MAG: ATP:cob(I)alamin adenosyltransferase [Candidatus Wolfebacteria bacterium RIFCSPLOWO2_01_FULL_38_11]
MLYTRKGDKGDTSAFGCNQRFSKNSALAEALGNVDEINSLLGICKVKSLGFEFQVLDFKLDEIIEQIQQDLFIIQAALAGADKKITQEKIGYLEQIIDELEKQLSPVKSFFISGGAELSALFDYSRAVSRRAERRVVAYSDSEKGKLAPEILAYLNRLSSLLYALARAANLKSGQKEKFPSYE